MRIKLLIVGFVLASVAMNCLAGPAAANALTSEEKLSESINELSPLKQRYSYGMGVNTILRFQAENVKLDNELFVIGMKHNFQSIETLMTDKQIVAVKDQFGQQREDDSAKSDNAEAQNNVGLRLNTDQINSSNFFSQGSFIQHYSYVMGIAAAKKLTSKGIKINLFAFSLGLKHGITEKELLINHDDIMSAITEIKQQISNEKLVKQENLAAKNMAESNVFFASNSFKSNVITTTTGIQYKVLRQGQREGKPNLTDKVKVHYRATLLDGTEINSSYQANEPVTYSVSGVIKGLSQALQMMTIGDKWQVFVPAKLGYGPNYVGTVVQPNSAIIIELELLDIVQASIAL